MCARAKEDFDLCVYIYVYVCVYLAIFSLAGLLERTFTPTNTRAHTHTKKKETTRGTCSRLLSFSNLQQR